MLVNRTINFLSQFLPSARTTRFALTQPQGIQVLKAEDKPPSQKTEIHRKPLKNLDDHFFPEENNLITKIDNSLIKAMGKVNLAYQYMTGGKEKELYRTLCAISAIGSGIFVAHPNIWSAMPILMIQPFKIAGLVVLFYSAKDMLNPPDFTTPLEFDMSCEMNGQNPHSLKYFRLFMLMASLTYMGASPFLRGSCEPTDPLNLAMSGFQALTLIPFSLCIYLTLTKHQGPPKSRFDKDLAKGIKKLTEPKPQLQPIPIPVDKGKRPRR